MELTPENLLKVLAEERHGLSTSQVARRFAPLHRMHVTGYLQAMVHVGVLSKMDRAPAHVYTLAVDQLNETVQVAQRLDDLLDSFKAEVERLAKQLTEGK